MLPLSWWRGLATFLDVVERSVQRCLIVGQGGGRLKATVLASPLVLEFEVPFVSVVPFLEDS